jgi:hypothetical protein
VDDQVEDKILLLLHYVAFFFFHPSFTLSYLLLPLSLSRSLLLIFVVSLIYPTLNHLTIPYLPYVPLFNTQHSWSSRQQYT